MLGVSFKERIAGSDFVWDIARLAAEGGYTMYLLGGRGEVAELAARELKIQNENLKIVGAEPGPNINRHPEQSEGSRVYGSNCADELRGSSSTAQNDNTTDIIQRIRNARPDILLVAFGHPRQEKWIAAHLYELPSVKIAMGVGGALDFIAGRVRRAPRVLRAVGLEWLWRLVREPRRLPRIFRAVIVFPLLVARQCHYRHLTNIT